MQSLYKNTQDRFLDICKYIRVPHMLTKYFLPYLSPQKEQLSTSLLKLGSDRAKNLLIITGGVNGMDFYIGNEIQQSIIRSINLENLKLSSSTSVLIVHCINPWGASWIRPTNINNVMLDMNFSENFEKLLHLESKDAERQEMNQIYTYCEKVINTHNWRSKLYHWPRMLFYNYKFGRKKFFQSAFTCQRSSEVGLSYGGNKLEQENKMLVKNVKSLIPENYNKIVHINIKTTDIGDIYNLETETQSDLESLKKMTNFPIILKPQSALPSTSLISGLKGQSKNWVSFDYSIRSSSRPKKFKAMRDENILHNLNIWVENWSRDEHTSLVTEKYFENIYKKNLLESYFPNNDPWKHVMIGNGCNLVAQLLSHLNEN